MTPSIHPDAILKELRSVWRALAREQADGPPVLRACSMTFIVAMGADGDSPDAAEITGALMPRHPSRAILLRLGREAPLEFRVLAQCWMPFGKRQQICAERIEISAPRSALADLDGVVRGLLAPDLPAALWCRSWPLLESPDFWPLASLARKVIADSGQAPSSGAALRLLSRLPGAADLAWTRLTPWRQQIARALETGPCLAGLKRTAEIAIRFPGVEPTPEGLYLAGWLAACMNIDAGDPRLRLGGGAEEGLAVRLSAPSFSLEVAGRNGALEVVAAGLAGRVPLPAATEVRLLGEELSIYEPDSVYHQALGAALQLQPGADP